MPQPVAVVSLSDEYSWQKIREALNADPATAATIRNSELLICPGCRWGVFAESGKVCCPNEECQHLAPLRG